MCAAGLATGCSWLSFLALILLLLLQVPTWALHLDYVTSSYQLQGPHPVHCTPKQQARCFAAESHRILC
jgi:hypothetical protein